jgi:hypothetical protein
MTDSCDHAISPLTYVAESGVASAFWVVPTFVTALVLVVAVFRSWRAKAKTALAFAAMGAFALTLPVLGAIFTVDGAHVMGPIYAVATLATVLFLMRARARAGWERLSSLLDAYAAAAFPLALTIAMLAKYAGAYAFVIAYVAFATQRALVAIQSAIERRRARAGADARRVRVGGEEPRARIGEREALEQDEAEEQDVRMRAASVRR